MQWERAQRGDRKTEVLSLNAQVFYMGTGSNPRSFTSQSTPCLWPGKAMEDGSKPWDTGPCGRPSGVPGPQLWIGKAPAVMVTWEVNHWMEDLLCLSSTMYILLCNKNKILLNAMGEQLHMFVPCGRCAHHYPP